MATYGADYLKRLLAAVERFEQVFERWTAAGRISGAALDGEAGPSRPVEGRAGPVLPECAYP